MWSPTSNTSLRAAAREAAQPQAEPWLKESYDVCVIGSGPGGAVTVATLAEAGWKVVLVERGPFFPVEESNFRVLDNSGRMGRLELTSGFRTLLYQGNGLDGGNSWEPDVRLADSHGLPEHPAIATSGESVYAVWHNRQEGGVNIFFRRSSDGGANWEPGVQISTSNGAAHSSIAVAGASVHVVWGDHRDVGQAEVYIRNSYDGGASWGSEMRVSELPFDSWVPTVEASGRNVYVAWVDTRDGNEEEYFRRSVDGGQTWGSDVRLTNAPGDSLHPCVATAHGVAHVVWFDGRDGRPEIYYGWLDCRLPN